MRQAISYANMRGCGQACLALAGAALIFLVFSASSAYSDDYKPGTCIPDGATPLPAKAAALLEEKLDHFYYGSRYISQCRGAPFGKTVSPGDPMGCGTKAQWKASVRPYITACAGQACDGFDSRRKTDCSPARKLVFHAVQRAKLQNLFDRELQLLMRFNPFAPRVPALWRAFIAKWEGRLRFLETKDPEVAGHFERVNGRVYEGFRFESSIRSLQGIYQGHRENWKQSEAAFKKARPEISQDPRAYRYKHVYEFLIAERALSATRCKGVVVTTARKWLKERGQLADLSSILVPRWIRQMQQTEVVIRTQYPEFGASGSFHFSPSTFDFQNGLYPRARGQLGWSDEPCEREGVKNAAFQKGEFNPGSLMVRYAQRITRTSPVEVLSVHNSIIDAFRGVQGHLDAAAEAAFKHPAALLDDPLIAGTAQAMLARQREKDLVRLVKCDLDNRSMNSMILQIGGFVAAAALTKGVDKVAVVLASRGAAQAAHFATRTSIVISKTVNTADAIYTAYDLSHMVADGLRNRTAWYSLQKPLLGDEWK